MPKPKTAGDEEFFPSGAVAFFGALVVFFGAIWLACYALMVHRS